MCCNYHPWGYERSAARLASCGRRVSGVDTATVSVVASSTVAVAAIGAAWLQHRAGLKHERTVVDLNNVRDVLDEAALALHRISYVLDDLRSRLTQHRPILFFDSDDGTELYRRLGDHGEVLDALLERVSVRLGRDHDVAKALSAADGAFLKIYRAVGLLRLEALADESEAARRQVDRIEREQVEKVGLTRERFDQARESFIGAAQRLAGARLR